MSDDGIINGAEVAAVENSPGVNNSVNPLDKLEGVVAAAQQAAAADQPTAPLQAPVETPTVQFENQFGSGLATPTPAVSESAPNLIDTALGNLGTAPSVENPNPAVEAIAPAEQTPADKLRKKISDDIDAFLEEVLQKQGVTS